MLLSRFFRCKTIASGLILAAVAVLPAAASRQHHSATSSRMHGRSTGKRSSARTTHGASSSHPRAMDDARATEIQGALVKAGYLQSASGHWDSTSADAMRKMQADNGWQTKLIPDSRALIKLGLGANSVGAAQAPTGAVTPTE